MKPFKLFLLAAATTMSALFSFGQTGDELITKSIDAIGGKARISQIKSLYLESTAQIMGSDAPCLNSSV